MRPCLWVEGAVAVRTREAGELSRAGLRLVGALAKLGWRVVRAGTISRAGDGRCLDRRGLFGSSASVGAVLLARLECLDWHGLSES